MQFFRDSINVILIFVSLNSAWCQAQNDSSKSNTSASKVQHQLGLEFGGVNAFGAGLQYRYSIARNNSYFVTKSGVGIYGYYRIGLNISESIRWGYMFGRCSLETGIGFTPVFNFGGLEPSKGSRELYFIEHPQRSSPFIPCYEAQWNYCLQYNYKIRKLSIGLAGYILYSYFNWEKKAIIPFGAISIGIDLNS